MNHKKNILNDSLLLFNNNKNTSIQFQSDYNNNLYSNNNINNTKISEKSNDETKISPKYIVKKGIPVKYESSTTSSKNRSQYGSLSRNSTSKIMSFNTAKINSELIPNIKKIFSPNLKRTRKIKWDQYGILNLSRNRFIKQKKTYSFQGNTNSIIETIKYRKKIKSINSLFSQYFCHDNCKQKIVKNNSSNNFLYSSLFFNSDLFVSPKKDKKITNKKRNNISLDEKIQCNDFYIPKKKKYHLIIDNDLHGKLMKSDDFPDSVLKMNKKSIKHLEIDNKKLFDRFYCIIDKKRFKKEYRNPFSLPFENRIHLIGKKKEKEENSQKKIINDEVFSYTNELLNDMTKEITTRPYKSIIHFGVQRVKKYKIKYSKNTLLEKFKEIIIKLSKYLHYIYGVSLSEILKEYKLPKICYTFRYTRELIYAIKTKKMDLCNKLLDNHKYIVLDYDYYYLTPLHWAVKKNFYQIIPKLIEYGSFLNFQNFIGETPLHIGVKKNYYECVTLLLVNMASPFIKDKDGKIPINLTKDFQMKILLENIMKIHYLSLFKNYSNKFEFIMKQFTFLIVHEFRNQLDKDIFFYFKEREYSFTKNKNI